jgi:Sec-independent protein translocase protein TatA
VNLDPEKVLMIGLLALVVLGPSRLPRVARDVGRAMVRIRRIRASLQSEMHQALEEPTQALRDAVDEFGISSPRTSLHDNLAAVFKADPRSSKPDTVDASESSLVTEPQASVPGGTAALTAPNDQCFN